MENPHPTSRSLAPIPLTFVGAPPREPSRARARPAVAVGYDRLAAAFPRLPEPLLVELAQGVEETFMPGETIVREGDPAERFYIIESGQVEGTQSTQEEMHGLTMQAGDYFGEVGVLARRTRTATVRAVSEVRVVSLYRAQFQALVDATESTAANLAPLVDRWTRSRIPPRTCSGAERCNSPTDPATDKRAASARERHPHD
jgi:CRP-like cAMP-binding protein